MIKQQLIQFAAKIASDTVDVPKINETNSIKNILTVAYGAAAITAVVIIVIAGIMYSSAVGDPEKIKNAKNTILYAVIGLIVVLLAFSITHFVIGRF